MWIRQSSDIANFVCDCIPNFTEENEISQMVDWRFNALGRIHK